LPEEDASRRRAVTQERGTRSLVIGFIVIGALWFLSSKLWDMYLLRQVWPPLPRQTEGLSVVSTLDRRGAYDRNLFRVVISEGSARAELTNFGWDSIFSGHHGALTSEGVGSTIRSAISLDSDTGYAMLAPLLAAEVRTEMGDPNAYSSVNDLTGIDTELPLSAEEKKLKRVPRRRKSLRELLTHFEDDPSARKAKEASGSTEGGTGSEHSVEHGLAIPGEVLVQTCPVVLDTRHFVSGSVEEHPEAILGGKTYSIWLDLTPEGRSRFYQWSRTHANEHLLLILNKEIVANGRIAMTMDVSKWEITNLKDGVAAHKLVDYINSHQSTH